MISGCGPMWKTGRPGRDDSASHQTIHRCPAKLDPVLDPSGALTRFVTMPDARKQKKSSPFADLPPAGTG